MDYSNFIEAAIREDGRNRFGKGVVVDNCPTPLMEFYSFANPIDVEITYPEIGEVKFCPCEELEELQQDYKLHDGDYAFATCNGDPLFMQNKNVFMTLPEVYSPEFVAESFESFINTYITNK